MVDKPAYQPSCLQLSIGTGEMMIGLTGMVQVTHYFINTTTTCMDPKFTTPISCAGASFMSWEMLLHLESQLNSA